MEKPFDVKALGEKLKAKGLPALESGAELVAEAVFEWTEESIALHPNPYVKFALPVIGAIKPMIKEQIDKIDGLPG